MKKSLVPQKVEVESQSIALERTKTGRLEPLRNWILQAQQGEKTVSQGDELEMKSFLTNVGSSRLLRAQILTVSFRKPWDSLAETNLIARSAVPDADLSSGWWTLAGSNR